MYLICTYSLGTIHLRGRQIFTIYDPYPYPSAFLQNAYEGDFWSLCTLTFWPSAHGDTPAPLRRADILNGLSLIVLWLNGFVHFLEVFLKLSDLESFKIVKILISLFLAAPWGKRPSWGDECILARGPIVTRWGNDISTEKMTLACIKYSLKWNRLWSFMTSYENKLI